MAYTLNLQCGCRVDVLMHPVSGLPRTRIVRARGVDCTIRRHTVGVEVGLWDPVRKPAETAPPDRDDLDGAPTFRLTLDLD